MNTFIILAVLSSGNSFLILVATSGMFTVCYLKEYVKKVLPYPGQLILVCTPYTYRNLNEWMYVVEADRQTNNKARFISSHLCIHVDDK